MRPLFPFLVLLITVSCTTFANETTPEQVRAEFTYPRAVVTGFVEGATEFLPISSTGHLILTNELLEVNDSKTTWVTGVMDRQNRPINLERVVDDYVVIIQIGSILAVVAGFYSRFRNPSARGVISTFLAFLPVAILGLLLKDFITQHLFRVEVVASTLLIGGAVMLWADKRWPREPAPSFDELETMTAPQALRIGIYQCVSLVPGISRSMSVLIGGRANGLSHAAAAEFSFLVGFLTLSAASLYKAWSLGPALRQIYPGGPALVGLTVAFLVSFVSVRWLIHYLQRSGFVMFAWYRIILGVTLLVWISYSGFNSV